MYSSAEKKKNDSGIRRRVPAKTFLRCETEGAQSDSGWKTVRRLAEGNGITSRLASLPQRHPIPESAGKKPQRDTKGRGSRFIVCLFFYSIAALAVMQRATRRTLISRAAFGSAGRIYGNWER